MIIAPTVHSKGAEGFQTWVITRVVTVLAFSVFFGFRAFDIFVRFFFGLSGLDYYVNEGHLYNYV